MLARAFCQTKLMPARNNASRATGNEGVVARSSRKLAAIAASSNKNGFAEERIPSAADFARGMKSWLLNISPSSAAWAAP